MNRHHLGGNRLLIARGEIRLLSDLRNYGFAPAELSQYVRSPYPNDITVNAARIGGRLFANCQALAPELKEYCQQHGIKIIPVRQGYAKCSAAIVDEFSLITSDSEIAQAAEAEGLDVLKIQPGHITLRGCDYGFIGGTCGKIGPNIMAFAGRIEDHPDYKQIDIFLHQRGIEPVALADCPLTDIGGILPLGYKK